MAERDAEFMSLPGKISGSFAPANITDGLWIHCSLSVFQWDFGEQLLSRHVTATTVDDKGWKHESEHIS